MDSIDWLDTQGTPEAHAARDELTELRAFKQACEEQKTQINLEAEIHKISARFLSKRHQGYFMGDIRALLALQAPSDPEAASLRMRIEELENSSIAYAAGQASKVPEGWKLVPVEPTYEMKKAAWDDYESDSHTGVESWWKAMLAAAPSQETCSLLPQNAEKLKPG